MDIQNIISFLKIILHLQNHISNKFNRGKIHISCQRKYDDKIHVSVQPLMSVCLKQGWFSINRDLIAHLLIY